MKEKIAMEWREAGDHPIEQCLRKFIAPIVNCSDPRTLDSLPHAPVPATVIRAQDYTTWNGKAWNSRFIEARKEGGIQKIPGFNHRNIILSSIGPDHPNHPWIRGFRPDRRHVTRYSELINGLNVPYYLTGDGPTYGNEPKKGKETLEAIALETGYALDNSPRSTPIALVNGSTIEQALERIDYMKALKIRLFAFYVGQCLYHGKTIDILRAKIFAREIWRNVPWLLIIGGGSSRLFQEYNFAKGFAIDSHWVGAYKGRYIVERKWKHIKNSKPTTEGIGSNLAGLCDILALHESQPKITDFIREISPIEVLMR